MIGGGWPRGHGGREEGKAGWGSKGDSGGEGGWRQEGGQGRRQGGGRRGNKGKAGARRGNGGCRGKEGGQGEEAIGENCGGGWPGVAVGKADQEERDARNRGRGRQQMGRKREK